jgi:hypothetical protein
MVSETWGTRGKITVFSHDFPSRTEKGKKLEMLVLQGASNLPSGDLGSRPVMQALVIVRRPAVSIGLAGSARLSGSASEHPQRDVGVSNPSTLRAKFPFFSGGCFDR